MSLDLRRRVVRRLDALLLAGLLLTSGAAGLLFALRFYNGGEERAESSANAAPTPTASPTEMSGRVPVALPVVEPLALAGTYAGAPLLLSGQAGPGDILQVYDGQELIAIAVAGQDGAWAVELPGGLLEGEHALAVVAVADDGATSQRVPVGFAVGLPPTATLTWTPSPTASATGTPAPTEMPLPSDTPTLTLVPSATPDLDTTVEALLAARLTETAQSWTDTPTVTLTPTPSATFSATPSLTPSATPSATPTSAPTLTATLPPTATFSPTPTPSPTITASPTVTASHTSSPTRTPQEAALLPASTATFTPAPTEMPLPSDTPTLTLVPSATPNLDATVEALLAVRMTEIAQSWTDTPTVTLTPTPSATFTATPSPTTGITLTDTPLPTETVTDTPPPPHTATFTPAPTDTPQEAALLPTDTATSTPAATETPFPTASATLSPVPPTRTPVSPGPALASPTLAPLVLPGAGPRIDAPASGEVRAPGPLVARGVAEPGATVVVREQAGGAALAITQASAEGAWTAQFSVARTGTLTLVASASGPDGLIRASNPVTITLAPPVQPVSGGMLLPDAQRAGRLFTVLLAVLFVAGGGSAFFAGRLLVLLARDHRWKSR